ncbi:hypothetical protein WBP07_16475 [Novosphingobium sp. BL-8A]|uniref:hypothetical protein n=1 Tax=Novosphingobium sp. BL-8A TaxID=3127639 RepID=UPI003757F28F
MLIRRDKDALMCRALDWPGRLVYLIDDDIAGAAQSPDLPADYRRRLAEFDQAYHRALLERADVLLVPSEPLVRLFAQDPRITAKVLRIFPYWPFDYADDRHFAELERGAPLRIAHLGSGSHAGAFAAVAPALAELLEGSADVHLTCFGRELPPALPNRHPRIARLTPMRWPAYRRWLPRQRFHLALYPLEPTPFDVARSANKVVEHAIVGAVGLYPEDWPLADLAGGGCLTAPADPADWAAALKDAVGRRAEWPGLVRQAARSMAPCHDRTAQRAIWREVLDLG